MNRKADARALVVILLAMLLGFWLQPAPEAGAMTPEDIYTMRTVGLVGLDSSGQRLLYTVGAWDAEKELRETTLYVRDMATGRDLLLLSPGDDAWGAAWRPDGKAIAYLKRGEQGTELWTMAPDGGSRVKLSDQLANFGSLQWAPDGSALAWQENVALAEPVGIRGLSIVADDVGYRHLGEGYREGRLHHLFVLELATDTINRVQQDSLDIRSFDWSPDSKELVFAAKARSDLNLNLNTDLWRVGRQGVGPKRITSNPGPDSNPHWLADGKIVYLRGPDPLWESGPQIVTELDPILGDAGPLQQHGQGFDNRTRGLVTDGERFFVFGARKGCLDLMEVHGDKVKVLTDGEHDFWAADVVGSRVVLVGASQTLPSAIFTVDLAEKIMGPHHPQVLIDPNTAWRQRVGLTDPEPFSVQVEGRTIAGWFFKPADLEPGQTVPTVLSIHGGPEWMYGGYFLPEFHILPSFGYGVIIANPTGSMGYGFEFQNGVRGDWVDRPGRELLACVDYAIAQGWADPQALAVMGGSYGGHLAAELTTRTDRFKAAAVDRMFPDLTAFWGTTDEKWFPEWEFNGRPWEDQAKEVYLRNSPTTRVDKVTTPTLISQGMLDYRCLIAGAEMWFSSLQALGVPSRFIRFEQEGHGLRDPRDKVFYQHQLLEFFDHHVLGLQKGLNEASADSISDDEFPVNE